MVPLSWSTANSRAFKSGKRERVGQGEKGKSGTGERKGRVGEERVGEERVGQGESGRGVLESARLEVELVIREGKGGC